MVFCLLSSESSLDCFFVQEFPIIIAAAVIVFFFGGDAKIGITSDDKDEFFFGVILTGGETGGIFFGKKIRERERHTQKVSRILVFFLFCLKNSGRIQIFIYRQHFARKVGGRCNGNKIKSFSLVFGLRRNIKVKALMLFSQRKQIAFLFLFETEQEKEKKHEGCVCEEKKTEK